MIFFIGVFVLVPWLIEVSGRWDFYYTLTSVALLSIASAGVWLTFYIGRINIGQGAYALAGGYLSAVLVTQYEVSFWLTIPLAGLFCAVLSVLIGLPILRLKGVYFAMITLVLTEVAKVDGIGITHNQWCEGYRIHSITGRIVCFWDDHYSRFFYLRKCEAGILLPSGDADGDLLCGHVSLG